MTAPVHYRIASSQPASHIYELEMTIAVPEAAGQRLSLPNWIPGSYMIRDFSRNVGRIYVVDGNGQPVAIQKTAKSEWLCAPAKGPLTLRYEVYAWDLSVRGAHLDQTHGFFNGTSVFLAAEGLEDKPHSVEIVAPEGSQYWEVATTLSRGKETPEWGFGGYQAESYDELIDHPVEMGRFSRARFMACGVPHDVVITGKHQANMDRLCRDLEKICRTQIEFFGGKAPFDHYIFLTTAVGNGYGGLEHRSSTALLCSRDDLPLHNEPEEPADRYRTFLGLCSHEYFHSWNVKRIKPASFIPYDLTKESHTSLLWAFEGITSYYDDLMLLRSGVISEKSYLELLGQQITRHLRTPGRFQQSVAESSWDAWSKYYKQDENAANSIVSYYVKGALVALCTDLMMRQRSGGTASLDQLMQRLWQEFGLTGKGVEEGDIPRLAATLCGELPEQPEWSSFWENALEGVGEIPFSELLVSQGLDCTLRASDNAADLGGKPAQAATPRLWWGGRVQAAEGGLAVQALTKNGPAQQAGLSAGDVIVAANGLRINNVVAWEKLLANACMGDVISLHAFRRDELMVFDVTLIEAPQDACVLTLSAENSQQEKARQWLSGSI